MSLCLVSLKYLNPLSDETTLHHLRDFLGKSRRVGTVSRQNDGYIVMVPALPHDVQASFSEPKKIRGGRASSYSLLGDILPHGTKSKLNNRAKSWQNFGIDMYYVMSYSHIFSQFYTCVFVLSLSATTS